MILSKNNRSAEIFGLMQIDCLSGGRGKRRADPLDSPALIGGSTSLGAWHKRLYNAGAQAFTAERSRAVALSRHIFEFCQLQFWVAL